MQFNLPAEALGQHSPGHQDRASLCTRPVVDYKCVAVSDGLSPAACLRLPAVGRVGRRGLVLKASAQGLALKGSP
jgi:hypothetical protein